MVRSSGAIVPKAWLELGTNKTLAPLRVIQPSWKCHFFVNFSQKSFQNINSFSIYALFNGLQLLCNRPNIIIYISLFILTPVSIGLAENFLISQRTLQDVEVLWVKPLWHPLHYMNPNCLLKIRNSFLSHNYKTTWPFERDWTVRSVTLSFSLQFVVQQTDKCWINCQIFHTRHI